MSVQLYPSDLADHEWKQLTVLLPRPKAGGRPRSVNLRDVLNAILYLTRTGCAWRYLPREYPPWQTVYGYFRRWTVTGLWQRIHDRLRSRLRSAAGRERQPSAAILDSQSVKTSHCGGTERGYDAAKRVTGRKRHILVDTLGLVLVVVVHAADIQDRIGARIVVQELAHRFLRIRILWADGGYFGSLPEWIRALRRKNRLRLEVVKCSDAATGFVVLPKRWIVERRFAWLSLHRRLSKDYEVDPCSSRAYIHLAMIRLTLQRLP